MTGKTTSTTTTTITSNTNTTTNTGSTIISIVASITNNKSIRINSGNAMRDFLATRALCVTCRTSQDILGLH